MKFIIVAGPAGSGKSLWARHLRNVFGAELVSTDEFEDEKWEDVPGAVYESIKDYEKDFPNDEYLIIEGVRALSVVKHNNLRDRVAICWWGEHNPNRPNCQGLLTRQLQLLQELRLEPRNFPWITYP